jgi:hypothetical protein
MATLTQIHKPNLVRIAFIHKCDEFIEGLIPRRCMLVSTGMILAGLGIPLLMLLQLLPVTFLFGFAGFALAVTGSVLALVFCGEI